MSKTKTKEKTTPASAGSDGSAHQHMALDYILHDGDDGWEVWTPDYLGACIGSGATQIQAIEDARLSLLATAAEIGLPSKKTNDNHT